MRGGNLKVVRDNIEVIRKDSVLLRSGDSVPADFIISATGWGDHFSMFDPETKAELGLPTYGKALPGGKHTKDVTGIAWEMHDIAADKRVNETLPFLAKGPSLENWHPSRNPTQRRWRLYKRSIPLDLAVKGDRSLVILGQIHTIQTPIVSEVQSFWSILYLIGDIDLPDEATMIKEIAEWNAWTRKRYSSVGQRYPYCLFDFLPVSQSHVRSGYLPSYGSLANVDKVPRRPHERCRRQLPPQKQLSFRDVISVQAARLERFLRRVHGEAGTKEANVVFLGVSVTGVEIVIESGVGIDVLFPKQVTKGRSTSQTCIKVVS